MKLSYNNLWKQLIDRGMNKTELAERTHMSQSTMAKLTKCENVNTDVLVRICFVLDCKIEDIVEFVKEGEK